MFKTLKEKEDGLVTFGDGSHSQVLGKGTIDISKLPLLTDVLYIKGLKVNLLRSLKYVMKIFWSNSRRKDV